MHTNLESVKAAFGFRILRDTVASQPTASDAGATPSDPAVQPDLPSGERVYRALKEQILSGELPPSTRLVELSLALQFGVSRTPIREALKRLAAEHIVAIDPPRGMVVKGIDQQEAEEVYTIREVLDGLAARLAAQRISDEDLSRLRALTDVMTQALDQERRDALVEANIRFHQIILDASANERLKRLGRTLTESVRRFSSTAFRSYEREAEVLREHAQMMEALERRDPEAAEQAAREHMIRARAFFARATVTAGLL